ncbi:unnamed protein product [Adineta ricciae]|uniref:G-protein coupled receptors family 1 profile domain-containing protein n=1 Tax=Adineta ricciae TaxID=249248 RepID=A0A813Q342_ADIRI|nr:unnamed protein product [Adineta ricciae]
MALTNRSDSALFITVNSPTLLSSSSLYYSSTMAGRSLVYPNETTTEAGSKHLKFVENLTTQITLIVSVIGLIGNACTMIVLNRQAMRKWRSSMLLSALAGVDFLYLLIIFLSIVDTSTGSIIGFHRSLIVCEVTVYITHICSFLSANFTLSFTLQRFVAVLFPLHANTIISSRSSTINIFILVLIGCSFYSFSFFVTHISKNQCEENENHPALYPLLIVDTCLTFVLPFIFILLFNCAIVYKLRNRKRFTNIFGGSLTTAPGSRNQRTSSPIRLSKGDLYHERQRLYESNSIDTNFIPLKDTARTSIGTPTSQTNRQISSSCIESTVPIPNELSPVSAANSNSNRQAISQRTTKMLVICSTTFLLFNSPYCAVLLYSIISKKDFKRTLGILRHFYFMSFCLNFFLYSLCGNRFRHELITLFKSCWQKCCTQNMRSHWLRIDKLPQEQNFTRVPSKTDA